MDITEIRSRARAGDPAAQYGLYHHLREQAPDEARSWLSKAAAGRYPPAVYEKGVTALGKELRDAGTALEAINEAAEAGFAAADYHLACLLVHGYGVARDAEAARRHLRKAVSAADPNALYAAALLFTRLGEPGAQVWATRLFQCAATAGFPPAFEALAARLANGMGISPERGAAAFWWACARRSGMPLGRKDLAEALANETPDRTRAEKLAAEVAERLSSLPDFDWPATGGLQRETLCEVPHIVGIPGMLNDDECAHLMYAAQPHLKKSFVVDPASGKPMDHLIRSSYDGAIGWRYHDIPYYLINRRYADAAGMPLDHGENMSVIRYAVGGEYRLHHDYFEAGTEDERSQEASGGQRAVSMFTYLNDVPEGGETEFPQPDLSIEPRRRMAVVFRNLREDGSPDERSKHASRPVIRGEKWLAVKWFRERPCPPPLSPPAQRATGP